MITSEQNIQDFIEAYSFRLTPETVDLYQKAVGQLLAYCKKSFHQITSKDIRNWIIHLEKEGYKSATVKSKLFGIKLFYQFSLDEQLITCNPMDSVTFPELEDTLPHYLEREQLVQLRKLVEGRKMERAIVEFLYVTGVRIREMVAIKKEDIDWSERIVNIQSGKRKKGRIVLFTRDCAEHLHAYLEERIDELPYLFINYSKTNRACVRTIQYIFKEYEEQLGVRLTPHTLRHTFAAHLAIKGMPIEGIQALLGHEDPRQTHIYARLYNHARKQMYDEWM